MSTGGIDPRARSLPWGTTALYEVVRDNIETLFRTIDDGGFAVRLQGEQGICQRTSEEALAPHEAIPRSARVHFRDINSYRHQRPVGSIVNRKDKRFSDDLAFRAKRREQGCRKLTRIDYLQSRRRHRDSGDFWRGTTDQDPKPRESKKRGGAADNLPRPYRGSGSFSGTL